MPSPSGSSEREEAIDDLIELVAAVDGLLVTQTDYDVENLKAVLGRAWRSSAADELRGAMLKAKRWTFIESGTSHPRFQSLFAEVATSEQRNRVGAALGEILL